MVHLDQWNRLSETEIPCPAEKRKKKLSQTGSIQDPFDQYIIYDLWFVTIWHPHDAIHAE